MLSGDNGILQRATDAKTETEKGQEKEIVALAYNSALAKKISNGDSTPITSEDMNTELTNQGATATGSTTIKVTFTVSQRQYTITSSGEITYVGIKNDDEQDDNELPTALGTKPYFPSDKFKQLEGTDLSNGLVITDKADNEDYGNEYVWIEVPNANLGGETTTFGPDYATQGLTTAKITEETITDEQKTKIETAMIAYVKDGLLNGSEDTYANSDVYKNSRINWEDEWYDTNGKKAIRGGKTTDAGGCGLTKTAYNTLYKNMLKSVYNNGGFWIGRYEAGIVSTGTARGNKTDSIEGLIPLSKVNSYPINYVTCSQAQIIASSVPNKGSYNSSLMFGIQWDCVLKYLNKRGSVSVADLTSNSSSWGNYYNQQFEIKRGKYSQASPWNVYIDYTTATANKVKVEGEVSTKIGTTSSNIILLTTGAADVNRKQNIYDLAGNVYEWTLEYTYTSSSPCAKRGGSLGTPGLAPASHRLEGSTSLSNAYHRFSCFTLLKI